MDNMYSIKLENNKMPKGGGGGGVVVWRRRGKEDVYLFCGP